MQQAIPTQQGGTYERFYRGDDERDEGLTLVEKAGIGVLTGAVGYAVARRTSLGNRMAKYIERDLRAAKQGAKEAWDKKRIPKLNGSNQDVFRIAKQMKEDFIEGSKKYKKQYDLQKEKLSSREADMERYVNQYFKMVGTKGTTEGEIFHAVDDSMRHTDLVKRIKNSANERVKSNQKEIINTIRSLKQGQIKRGSFQELETHFNRNGINDKNLIKDVHDLRLETNERKFLEKNSKESIQLLDNLRKSYQKVFMEETPKILKQENILKRSLGGSNTKQLTVNDAMRLHKEDKMKLSEETYSNLEKMIKENNKFGENIYDKNLILRKDSKGNEFVDDYNVLKEIKRDAADWFGASMPGGILHIRDFNNAIEGKELFNMHIFRRGTQQASIQSQTDNNITDYLEDHLMKIGGKVVKVFDKDAAFDGKDIEIINKKRDIYLTSNSTGSVTRMVRHVADVMTPNDPNRNKIMELLDIGNQDKDNNFHKLISVFSKFTDDEWTRNWVNNSLKNGVNSTEDFFRMRGFLQQNTRPLSTSAMHKVNGSFDNSLQNIIDENNINFSRDEDLIKLFEKVGEHAVTEKTGETIGTMYRQYQKDPQQFLQNKKPFGESSFIMGDIINYNTGEDQIKKALSQHMLQSLNRNHYLNSEADNIQEASKITRKMFDDLYEQGQITRKDYEIAQEGISFEQFNYAGRNINKSTNHALSSVNQLYEDERFANNTLHIAKRSNPLWESTVNTINKNTTDDDMIAVNKADIFKNMMGVFDNNKTVKERIDSFIDPFMQLNGGRNHMDDFTTLSMIPYYAGYRLQDMLGTIGLGFSDKSMGSTVSLASNLFLKRLLPAYMGVEAYKYADYKLDEATGTGIDERYQNMIANHRLSASYNMSDEERAEENRKKQLKPGLEHWEAMPNITLPILGEVGPGQALNNVSNLFFANTDLHENSTMTPDEVIEDLYNGEKEVRKSRWWTAGSKSAYRGDRVSEFAPNDFRLAHSDYEWSGTNLTADEYFSSRLYPTLENPLGGLGYVFGTADPYIFEKKHQEDRPYLLTGELFNSNTMFFGDTLNATVGQLVKPVISMHEEYSGNPLEVQQMMDELTDNSKRNFEDNQITTQVGTGGRIKNVVYANADDYGGYNHTEVSGLSPENPFVFNELRGQYYVSNQVDSYGRVTGDKMIHDIENDETIYVPANYNQDASFEDQFTQAAAGGTKTNIAYGNTPTYKQTYQAQVSTAPRAMLDPDYAYKNELRNQKLSNVVDPNSTEWRAQEGIENWTEPLGVYKWLFSDELLGYSPYENEMVMQKADNAYSFSKDFWESNLGSLGGDYSEFGRRFVRKDSGQLDFYNPIKNTMPDWLPGSNYFINFQQGDPYSKVDHGERRLPGAAYESLNELHPDEFGEYGAFDRFKILGDVAPWSDEYKYWSQFLLDNLEDEDLRKEATDIRRQVSTRKEKYDFTPYRFKDNDVEWIDVTVDKFLDGTTFKSKELGDQAIRLAGVDHHQNPKGLLNAYLDEGQKVTIGIAKDESKRIAKDTYKTMNAVVLDNLNNINQDIIRNGYMRENENDFSAPGIYARFTTKEISQGKRWETFAHADMPANTKFLQVRTAVEEYERDQIYGKDWATWNNLAIRDYLLPTIEGLGRHDNYASSAVLGGLFGLTVGFLTLPGGRSRKVATALGAALGIGAHGFFNYYEDKHGEQWKPERRRKEEDINEYFDFLEYSKYSGLYENAREEIYQSTGVDVEEIVGSVNDRKRQNKEMKKALEKEKQKLFIEQPRGWEKRKKEINKQLAAIQENGKFELTLPTPILQALKYREERDTTLFAIDPTQDLMQVQKAMPYKDKWFFMEFVNATEKEKEKLMKLLPENQKRIYQSIWTHEKIDGPDESYYLQKYGGVPDATWAGWRPDIDLKDIKAQVVNQEGLDLTDFGLWEDDLSNRPYVPPLNTNGQDELYGQKSFSGYNNMENDLYQVLKGAGIYDASVIVSPNDTGITNVNIDIEEDRSGEVSSEFRMNSEEYI